MRRVLLRGFKRRTRSEAAYPLRLNSNMDIEVESPGFKASRHLLASVGFSVENPPQMDDLMLRAAEKGEPYEGSQGIYKRWRLTGGSELWLHLSKDGREMKSFDVYYLGESSVTILVEKTDRFAEDSMHGVVVGTVVPPEPGEQEFPIAVDLIDFDAVVSTLVVGSTIKVAVTAVPHELRLYPDDPAFSVDTEELTRKANGNREGLKLDPQFFVPSGLFGDRPRPQAWFAGHIRSFEHVVNPVGSEFLHVSVRSLGGVYDIVADPAVVIGEPRVGGVAYGTFALVGQIKGSAVGFAEPVTKVVSAST